MVKRCLKEGLVAALALAAFTAACGENKATPFGHPGVENITVKPAVDTVSIGNTVPFEADVRVVGNTENRNVTWSVGDSSIATIDDLGNAKGLAVGSTNVIATAVVDPDHKDTAKLVVKKK